MSLTIALAASWLIAFVVAFALVLTLCLAADAGDRMAAKRRDRK